MQVDGFRIVPPMGMGSWAAFAPTGDGSEMVVMGDVVVLENTLDTDRIAEILGYPGELNRGVYKVTIGRSDVQLTSDGTPVTTDMGFST